MSLTSQGSEFGRMLALNEDDALKIILANTKQTIPSANISKQNQSPQPENKKESPQGQNTVPIESSSDSSSSKSPEKVDQQFNESSSSGLGNSLNRQSGWSFDESQNDLQKSSTAQTPLNRSMSQSIDGAKSNEHSYHALIESYNMVNGPDSVPNLEEVWSRFSDASTNSVNNSNDNGWNANNLDSPSGFEFITPSTFDKNQIAIMLAQIGKLPQEKGLDNQNYECFGCKHPLGVNLSKPR